MPLLYRRSGETLTTTLTVLPAHNASVIGMFALAVHAIITLDFVISEFYDFPMVLGGEMYFITWPMALVVRSWDDTMFSIPFAFGELYVHSLRASDAVPLVSSSERSEGIGAHQPPQTHNLRG